ncbi:MAG: hypothetical protein AB7D38_08395 [Sulfurimonas sp.]|uniref:hypothetical protein n=1 Tax=Sulfurimonas sp. TaxID=2022749 RepID=UPI003D0E73E9
MQSTEILERYERADSGEVIIDVSTQKIEDLYSTFDKKSHFLKKDLNQDLVDYIIECATEIGETKFLIRFNFESKTEDESASRLKNSVKRFFVYLQEHEHAKMKEMLRKSGVLLLVGALLAALSIGMAESEFMEKSIVFSVLSEGLTVAAWVSLWEALAIFLIKWMPYKKKISLYERIANAKIVFAI